MILLKKKHNYFFSTNYTELDNHVGTWRYQKAVNTLLSHHQRGLKGAPFLMV